MSERSGGTGLIVVAFLASMAGSVGFIVAYQTDAGTQWLGASLAVAFGGIGCGLAWWSRRLMPQRSVTEQRPSMVPPVEEERKTADAFESGRRAVRRRGLLGGLLAAALGALGLGAVWPVRSLGPSPDQLRRTVWRPGMHLVDDAGERVPVDALDVGGVLTVFPEGREPKADDQVLLLRLAPGDLALPEGRGDWTPEGYIAYSKVCTHAGCPVGLYQNVGQLLLCPCHQATFDVVRGAVPVFGPAARPLPQLPLRVGDDDTLLAAGEFSGPVGPDRWRLDGAGDGGS